MNYLQLCERFRSEAGVTGQLTTAQNQTGQLAKVVNWVQDAYTKIQNMHEDWNWLRREARVNTVDGTRGYSWTAFTDQTTNEVIARFASWVPKSYSLWLSSSGRASEQWISPIHYDKFRTYYDFGSLATQESRPTIVTVAPDKSLRLYPTPDNTYVLRADYMMGPQTLSADTEEPEMPERYHMAIVWRALMIYGEERSAPEAYAEGKTNFDEVIGVASLRERPKVTLSGALG